MKVAKLILITFFALCTRFAVAEVLVFDLDDPKQDVVGKVQVEQIEPGDTLESIAQRYHVAYYDLLRANPELDERIALLPWHKIVIPGQHVLPAGERQGLIINLPEMRLYYFTPDKKQVMIAPIGIGRVGWMTPTGDTMITMRLKHPNWTPTKSVREAALKEGKTLPAVMPAGPDNPLGDYALLLGWKSYVIHGTNRPDGVGKRSSAGCFRMYPEDIQFLYEHVRYGTPVKVMNTPVKLGWLGEDYLMQAFPALDDYPHKLNELGLVDEIHEVQEHYRVPISWSQIDHILDESTGLARAIAHRDPQSSHLASQKEPVAELVAYMQNSHGPMIFKAYAETLVPASTW